MSTDFTTSDVTLYKYQEDTISRVQDKRHCAFYLDMGLGKTFVGSERLHRLGNRKNLVVVQRSKIDDWIEHFKEFYNYEVYNLRNKNHLDKFMKTGKPTIGIINYDLIWRRPVISDLKEFTLLLDESSYIKTPTAKRTRFIMGLRPSNVILLSGTPVSGKYEEIWTQCKLLGWNISKREFWRRYVITHRIDVGGFPIDIVVGYKNVEELKSNLANYGAVFMKTNEVIDLPDQVETDIWVKPTPEYNRFKKDSYINIDGIEIIGDYTLTKMLGERQLCSIYNKNKETAFKDLINSTSDRLVVFYNFKAEYERLKDLIGDRPYSVVNGDKRDLKAYKENDDSITFIQYQAGSMGLNLQLANKMIYYSPPLSVEHYSQSKKRIHRVGQDKTCFYYFLKTNKSIEVSIYQALNKGEDFTNKLFEKTLAN